MRCRPCASRDGAAGPARPLGLDTHLVDDVILGCVDPVGEAGGDVARAAVFAAGYGAHVPGMQINRFCASGLDAVNLAAAQVMSGQHDLVVAGGVESMSRIGIGASGGAWPVDPSVAIPSYFMPQGVSADLIATKYGFSRDDCDAYAVESQRRAAEAWERRPLRELGGPGYRHQRPPHPRARRAHAPRHQHAVARRAESGLRDASARWAASTPSPPRRIRMSRRSSTSTMPATRPASSMARRRC